MGDLISAFLTCEESLRKVNRQRESSKGCSPRYTRGIGINLQLMLIDKEYDEAALSLAMRASRSESRGTM
jgi:hypothetical protein